MAWLNHPAYARLRDRLIQRFQGRVFTFERLRPLVFLCGGAASPARNWIADYLHKQHPDKLVFYAEDVWEHISAQDALNALEMENQLGQLADAVIVVVESPGTLAELGAFSLSGDLRKKLLPIVHVRYKGTRSFINTGPIKWVDADSLFAPTIYADFAVILEAAQDIEERLARIHRRSVELVDKIAFAPKHLLFLLCDLLAIIGPAPGDDCSYYLEQILGNPPAWNVPALLGLGVSLKIIRYLGRSGDSPLYYRPLDDDRLVPFQHRRMFDLSAERAKFLGVLQLIGESKEALQQLGAG